MSFYTGLVLWMFSVTVALALAMPTHALAVFGTDVGLRKSRRFRIAGFAGLIAAFGAACFQLGAPIALISVLAAFAVAGFAATIVLSIWPRRLPSVSIACLCAGVGLIAVGL